MPTTTASSSKLAYLSKYQDKDRTKKLSKKKTQKNSKKEKKETKKRRHDSWYNEDDASKNSDLMMGLQHREDQSDIDDHEDDGPVVVEGLTLPSSDNHDGAAIASHTPRGIWQSEGEQDESEPQHRKGSTPGKDAAVRLTSTTSHRRRRYDSDDEVDHNNKNARTSHRNAETISKDPSRPRSSSAAARYDSDDESVNDGGERPRGHRRRYDSLSASEKSSSSSPSPPRQRKRRYDSSSDEEDRNGATRQSERRSKHHSRRSRRDKSPTSDDSTSRSTEDKQRSSSGHRSGLQSSAHFAQDRQKLMQQHKNQAQAVVDQYGMGDTVYRDAHGRKVTSHDNEVQQEQHRKRKMIGQHVALNTGRVQREALEAQQRRMEELAASSFARHSDDAQLEEMRKNAVREGDPMAQYATASSSKRTTTTSEMETATHKPIYKGPPAKPNRFNIRPGFRWDGVDRGNGFEDRLLAQQYSRQQQKEQAYRRSAADM